ncbi:hypothetical protein ASZ78_000645 [Callipepla squamata]|uniref:Acyl-coenzyme A oxidase n=1 Tax=Callipepla squamata TaxID=9009 RepID=A0A226NFP9_CALSU|nr:hypothetical protein ASZ78_000645 [Callipepla squamata]
MALLDATKDTQGFGLTNVNPDLASERLTGSFSVPRLTAVLDGGAERTRLRRAVVDIIESDPVFGRENQYFQNQNERYEAAVRKAVHVRKKMQELGWSEDGPESVYVYRALSGDVAFLLHRVFMRSISMLGSDKQVAKWIPLATEYQLIGSYGQTELGHVGRSATHTVVFAQLYIHGKCYGVHPFIVQIRSLQDHSLCPGITAGDIGPKMNFEHVDNGYLMLKNVRIPRENMLNKFCEVQPDGTYIRHGSQQINYFTMTSVRISLISDEVILPLMKACTIAIRYSVVRRQSKLKPGFLIKCFAAASAGQPVPPSVTYLAAMKPGKCPAKDKLDFLSPDMYTDAYQHAAIRLISSTAAKLQDLIQSGAESHEAWNQCTVQLVQAAKAHCHYITVKNFVETVEKLESTAGIQNIMKHLRDLFALHGIFSNAGIFLHDGYLTGAQMDMVTASYLDLLAIVRKDAVPLVDAFDFTDKSLNSALGAYDGQVYQRLYEWAQKAPTNKQISPAYEKYLKPLLHNKLSKL